MSTTLTSILSCLNNNETVSVWPLKAARIKAVQLNFQKIKLHK